MKTVRVLENGDVYIEVDVDPDVVIMSTKFRYLKKGIVDEHGFKQEDIW